jgi:hypothetical protein
MQAKNTSCMSFRSSLNMSPSVEHALAHPLRLRNRLGEDRRDLRSCSGRGHTGPSATQHLRDDQPPESGEHQ